MSTGTKVIQNALKYGGNHSSAMPALSDTITDLRDMLNNMLQGWESEGINIGAMPLSAAGDELGEPADTTLAIEMNLAVLSSVLFDNGKQVVSPQLRANANNLYEKVKSLYQVLSIPKKVVSSTLPCGEGNSRGRYRDKTFFGEGGTLDN